MFFDDGYAERFYCILWDHWKNLRDRFGLPKHLVKSTASVGYFMQKHCSSVVFRYYWPSRKRSLHSNNTLDYNGEIKKRECGRNRCEKKRDWLKPLCSAGVSLVANEVFCDTNMPSEALCADTENILRIRNYLNQPGVLKSIQCLDYLTHTSTLFAECLRPNVSRFEFWCNPKRRYCLTCVEQWFFTSFKLSLTQWLTQLSRWYSTRIGLLSVFLDKKIYSQL